MKRNLIILAIAGALLVGLAGQLTYMRIQSEPKAKTQEVHKVVAVKSKVHTSTNKGLDYGIHFVNENQFPMFKKYKASVLPFIQSQYPTNFVVDITLTNVTMDNWKMEIFYNVKITESNYYSFTQKDLNYTCNVRSIVPIPDISTYQKTDSTMQGSHYNIPANTTYLTVKVNGNDHIQFLVNGSGVCNNAPIINTTPIINQSISPEIYHSSAGENIAPYIYSIIDSDGVVDGGFINANAKTVKYTLADTPIYTINKTINVPTNTPMYYYPSIYSQEIVSTNSPMVATAIKEIRVSTNKYMYLVSIQGQSGWVEM